MSELHIKVNIASRTYPLTVSDDEEEEVRKAAQFINEKIKTLESGFAVKDKQDLLAMLALELTLEKGHGKEKALEESLEQRINDLNQRLEQALK